MLTPEYLFHVTEGAEKITSDMHKTVSSVSSGNESISYANGNSQSNRYTVAATNVQEEKRILLEAAVSYLFNVTDDNGVYLLYRGI